MAGVPVKSPFVDWKLHTGPSVGTSFDDGASPPPSREFERSPPYEGQSLLVTGLLAAAGVTRRRRR